MKITDEYMLCRVGGRSRAFLISTEGVTLEECRDNAVIGILDDDAEPVGEITYREALPQLRCFTDGAILDALIESDLVAHEQSLEQRFEEKRSELK